AGDRPDEHLLAGRGLIAVGLLAGDGQRPERPRRDPGPERDLPGLVERSDRDEDAVPVAEPRLVEAASRKPRKPGCVELDPPARRGPRERRLPGGARRQSGRGKGGTETLTGRARAHRDQPRGERGNGRRTRDGADEDRAAAAPRGASCCASLRL